MIAIKSNTLRTLAVLALLVAGRADAQLDESALRLAVQITAYHTEEGDTTVVESRGTGIVARADGSQLTVLTARHVLEYPSVWDRPLADSVQLCFYALSCHTAYSSGLKRIESTEAQADGGASDVGIIVIGGLDTSLVSTLHRSLNRLGNVSRVGPGDPVTVVGCSASPCWRERPQDRVVLNGDAAIGFATFSVNRGDSGGPLFNQWGEVVGMNVQIGEGNVPVATALRIDHVLDTARVLGLTDPGLRRPPIPRQGYRGSIGVTIMKPGSSPLLPEGEDRLPSMRILIHRTLIQDPVRRLRLEGYGGYNRIAAENLSATGSVIGVSGGAVRGILGARAFLEVGGSSVEARQAVDTLVVNGTPIPVWERLQARGLGFGGGAVVDLILFRHTVLEAIVGYWNFGRPEGAPAFPSLVYGLGIRAAW